MRLLYLMDTLSSGKRPRKDKGRLWAQQRALVPQQRFKQRSVQTLTRAHVTLKRPVFLWPVSGP